MNSSISVSGLRKAYRDKTVLDGVDLEVQAGTVFALLGPNGAGKTTTVNVLTTLLTPDAGRVVVAGHDVVTATRAVRAAVGVTGQFASVDDLLTGRENLLLMADLLHLPRAEGRRVADRLLERFDLVDAASKRAASYSGGMTIFLTTQYLDEADQLADRIAVLDQGRIIAEGTAEELKHQIPGSHVRLRFADRYALDVAARALPESTKDGEELTLRVPGDGGVKSLRTLLARLDEHSIEVEDLSVHTPDLDDVFLALTGAARKEAIAR